MLYNVGSKVCFWLFSWLFVKPEHSNIELWLKHTYFITSCRCSYTTTVLRGGHKEHITKYYVKQNDIDKKEKQTIYLTLSALSAAFPFQHISIYINNINWWDVKRKNVVNNVDMSSLREPWQKGKVVSELYTFF